MRISPYTPADFERTLALWRAVAHATYHYLPTELAHTEEEDRAYFRDVIVERNELWLAEHDDDLVGYLAIADGYIDRLYVAVERQRQGVGTALLQKARELSPAGLRLHTHQQNVGAFRFYQQLGFEAIRYGISPPPESMPDVEFSWVPAP